MCSAASRLIIDERIKDEFLEKLVAFGRTMAPGNPLDPDDPNGRDRGRHSVRQR